MEGGGVAITQERNSNTFLSGLYSVFIGNNSNLDTIPATQVH